MNKMILMFTLLFTLSAVSAEKTKMITLNVSGMTCESCAGTVEKALKKVDGVKDVKVELKNKKATVVLASTGTSASLIKAVSDAGFTANEGKVSAQSKVKKQSNMEDENCKDGCCDDKSETSGKPTKTKKTDTKKS